MPGIYKESWDQHDAAVDVRQKAFAIDFQADQHTTKTEPKRSLFLRDLNFSVTLQGEPQFEIRLTVSCRSSSLGKKLALWIMRCYIVVN